MSDELLAAEALEIFRALETPDIERKATIEGAILHTEQRDVTTLFSVDDVVDRVGDVTSRKAFSRSVGLGIERIPHLFQHDDRAPAIARILKIEAIGRGQLPADVQRAYPEASGGMVAISRFLKSGRGAEVFEGIQEGIAYGGSFGYITKKASAHPVARTPDGRPARHLEEVHLAEVTTCLPGTAINPAARSHMLGKALALLEELEELKAGSRHSARDIDLLNDIAARLIALGATNITLLDAEPAEAVDPLRTSASALIDDIRSIISEVPT